MTPFFDPLSRTHWLGRMIFALVGLVMGMRRGTTKNILGQAWQIFHSSILSFGYPAFDWAATACSCRDGPDFFRHGGFLQSWCAGLIRI